jgi:hypothetical protein
MTKDEGLTLRRAALLAGFGYLLTTPVFFVEFFINPKLVIRGHIEQTAANIGSHHGLFLAAIFGYLINFIGDIIAALGLFILLAPVNRAVSLLAAWFRLIYTAVALVGLFNLVTVYRMLTTPDYLNNFGSAQFYAQIDLLLHSFRYVWTMGLVIFALHLILIAALVYRSGYMPKILGLIIAIDALCLLAIELRPYFWPTANLGWVFIGTFGEIIFMLWLLIMGWRIREPAALGDDADVTQSV